MARFAERADPTALTAQEIVEQLAAYLAGKYQAAETYLTAEVARRAAADMNIDDPARRLRSIRALREAAEQTFAGIDSEAEARRIVDIATREGTVAAVEQLGITQAAAGGTSPAMLNGQALPLATGLTPQAAAAAAQIGLELSNALADVRQRVLRSTADAYQETIARFAGERLLGVTTGRQSRTRAVADFLGQGIAGFTDRAGRQWRIGSYVEMASRTATNRAWISAHVTRWQAAGISLVSIVRGVDSCRPCAEWSGRILSTDGTPAGQITLEHATTGEPVTLTIAGTLDDARAGGWNHPNCRCTLAPVFPGLSLPADESTYDPQQERDRERLRALERNVRDLKRREQVAAAMGDDVAAAGYRRRIREGQTAIREHVANTGQLRKPYREALSFADGAPGSLPDPTPTPLIPDGPDLPGTATAADDAPEWIRRHREAAARLPDNRRNIGYRTRAVTVDEQRAAALADARRILNGFDETELLAHADNLDDTIGRLESLHAEARTWSRIEQRKTWPPELRGLARDAGRINDTPASFMTTYADDLRTLRDSAGEARYRVTYYREQLEKIRAREFTEYTERLTDLVDGDLGPDTARALDAVLDSGAQIDDEIRRRMAARGTPFTTSEEVVEEINRLHSLEQGSPEWDEQWSRFKQRQQARNVTEQEYARTAREVLAEVRPMGGGPRPTHLGEYGTNADVREAIDQAYSHYPDEWNARIVAANPTVETRLEARGYNAGGGREIVISGSDSGRLASVATHELGHSAEAHVPGVTNLEWAFHYRRSDKVTGADGLPMLAPARPLGANYGPDEIYVPDAWAHNYQGKVYRGYGDPQLISWEIFTMGIQGIMHGDPHFDRAGRDDLDYRRFILGVLASV